MSRPLHHAAIAAAALCSSLYAPGADDGGAAVPFEPQLRWGAELEFELSDAGSDAAESDPRFQVDQLYLYPELLLQLELKWP